MSGFLTRLFKPKSHRMRAERLLEAISAQARLPVFYETFGVADTIDGRFDMMAVHGAIVFRAARAKGAEGANLAQDTTDLMFMAFDDAIRSLGVGDQGIPRRVKAMAKAYIGRAISYSEAVERRDHAALQQALERNIYRGEAPNADRLADFAQYVMGEAVRLESLRLEAFQTSALQFSAPSVVTS